MATTTALQESSQALFCAIADFLGKQQSDKILDLKKYPTYQDFKSKNQLIIKKVLPHITVKEGSAFVPIKDIENFLVKQKSWYISSLKIGLKIVNDLTAIDKDFGIAKPNFQNLYYLRGDKDVMGNISELFKAANKNTDWTKLTGQASFGDINKWNPADIYLASNKAKKAIIKELDTSKQKKYFFTDLNTLTSDLVDSGDLLPLSLKKATGTVNLIKVNFDDKHKVKLLSKITFEYFHQGAIKNDWKMYKPVSWDFKNKKPKSKTMTRDLQFRLKTPTEIDIKLRHDPSSGTKGAFKIEVLGGGEARGGSIASIAIFTQIISFIDPVFSRTFLKTYNLGVNDFVKEMNSKKFYKNQSGRKAIEESGGSQAFNHARGEISALMLLNKIMPTLSKWLKRQSKPVLNKFARLLFEYITSRSKQSGKFVIAK